MRKLPETLSVFCFALFFFLLSGPGALLGQEIEPGLFKPSAMVSIEISKEQIKQIYREGGQTRTLHCGCFFDKQSQVYPAICDHAPRKSSLPRRERKILGWARAMPLTALASSLKCWNKPVCNRSTGEAYQGLQCCREISPKFKSMEADMHNLFPTFSGDDGGMEATSGEERFGGMKEYRFCSEPGKPVGEPRAGARGDIARAYFYMSYLYKISIADELEDTLRMWHLKDPPDAWEEDKNSVIEIVQGNRNPFIDHPELAERVSNF